MRATDHAALLIGFLNTAHLPDGVDALAGSGPQVWLADGQTDSGRSMCPAPDAVWPVDGRDALAELRILREGLRAALVRGPRGPGEADLLAHANAVLGAAPLHVGLAASPAAPITLNFGPEPEPGGAAGTAASVAAVARAAVLAQADGSIQRVRLCARSSCRWAFYDASRNRSRQWCSMAGCGNVMKNRAYRARLSTG